MASSQMLQASVKNFVHSLCTGVFQVEPPSKTTKIANAREAERSGEDPPLETESSVLQFEVVAGSNSLLDVNRDTVLQNTAVVKWTTHFFVHKHSVDRASARHAKHQRSEMGNPIF